VKEKSEKVLVPRDLGFSFRSGYPKKSRQGGDMQGTVKVIATLAILGAAVIGILVVLEMITDAAARDMLIKTAWVLGIIGVASLLLGFMTGSKDK
jgi:hypothetical protein